MASFKPLALVLSLLPVVASAQESTPDFRPGQWALQFGGNLNLATFGIMRFSSPRSALVLNVDLTASFMNGKTTDPFGGSSDANDHTALIQGSLGKRFYQSVRSKVRSFQTIGIVGGYVDQKVTFSPTTTSRSKSVFGGLQGEVGGGYWLWSNLSLGGTASARVAYSHQESSQSGGFSRTQHGFGISGVNVTLVLGLYF